MPTYEHSCPNENCVAKNEYEIEPANPGSRDEPPSGGFAMAIEDECEVCDADLTGDEHLNKVYEDWQDSGPEEPEKKDDGD